jgi:cysteine desulfuration protein SufE
MMEHAAAPNDLPPAIRQVLARFQSMEREEKMQALVSYAKRLEPVPERFASLDRAEYTVHECQTRVDLFSELDEGRMHFWADVNVRQSPTVAAFLSITLGAVNGQPPSATLSIPADFVSVMMSGLGLSAREAGLNGLVARLKREARAAREKLDSGA